MRFFFPMEAWHKVLQTKDEIVKVQYHHKHKYKDYIWYEAAAQNYLDVPDMNAVVVNVRDITAIKETEAALVGAKERAEVSDRLKTAYAGYYENQKALGYRCLDYISKPTKHEQLLAILNKYLKTAGPS